MQEHERQKGWTLIELLSACMLVGLIMMFAIPSFLYARRNVYEDNAISRLRRIALAESRYYAEYERFGNFRELVDANYLPIGYSTVYKFQNNSPISESSVLAYIDRYSLVFFVPNSPNSLYYKVDAIPVGYNRMGLRTFNINLFVTGQARPDNILQEPPVREGLDPGGTIVQDY